MLNDRFTKLEIQKLSLSCARMTSFSKTCFLRSKANMGGVVEEEEEGEGDFLLLQVWYT